MSQQKKIHIIPHSHWDREWYMPFESHRFRLVKLIDDIIETMEKNPEYKYYHLDGQTIVLEDYIKIKPYMKDRLQKLIEDGRIQIGPWYVLQDEYLISDEANVRNMLIGFEMCDEWNVKPTMIGYLPDSFGNITQMPQILKKFGIDCAVYGRGFGLKNSEVIWESEDLSRVVGVWLAGWYNNAAELPVDAGLSKAAVDKILNRFNEFSAVDDYPGMNGSDHQPLQKNLTEAIRIANEVAPENVEILHSNLIDYTNAVKESADKFPILRGEISGQHTNGFNRLVATASSRIYLKQLNKRAENKLEREAEPLSVMSHLNGGEYQADFIKYAWKRMLENHAHDSICGCSIDFVNREMEIRFNNSIQVSDEVSAQAKGFVSSKINVGDNEGIAFAVFNTAIFKRSDIVELSIECPLGYFDNGLTLKDSKENEIPCEYTVEPNKFTYTLPSDAFRRVEYKDIVHLKFFANDVSAFGYNTYFLLGETSDKEFSTIAYGDNYAENEFELVLIEPNGSLTVIDKATQTLYKGMNIFEDTPDVGDEYSYSRGEGAALSTANSKADISIFSVNAEFVTFKIKNTLKAENGGEIAITTFVTVYKRLKRVDIHNEIDNNLENHRLRAIFTNEIKTEASLAHGQFDIVERPIKTGPQWTCPDNEQRMQSFVALKDDKNLLMVATKALHEFEVLRDGSNTLCITVLKAIDRMGDWGEFPTPEAQCLGLNTADYSILVGCESEYRNFAEQALLYACDGMPTAQIISDENADLPAEKQYFSLEGTGVWSTAVKKAEKSKALVLRLYNLTSDNNDVVLNLDEGFTRLYETDLKETESNTNILTNGKAKLSFKPKEIKTLIIE